MTSETVQLEIARLWFRDFYLLCFHCTPI